MAEQKLNYLDNRRCIKCINSKFRENIGGKEMFFCGKHKTYVTDLTLCFIISGCHGKDYISRMEEKNKPKPKEPAADYDQMTFEDWGIEVMEI